MSKPGRRLARIRGERSMLHRERRLLIWNHGTWTRLSRLKRKAERLALKDAIRDESA